VKQILRLTLGLLALVALSACAQDPRKVAEAYRIETEANSQSANEQLVREQQDELHRMEMERLATEQRRREATEANRIAALNAMWTSVKITGSIAIGILLLALSVSVSRASWGVAEATAMGAMLKSNLIPLDRVTRQFPLLRHVHGTRFALSNPNTGSVVMLDAARNEDRQLIAAMGVTQLAGVVAQEARQSSDPAGLAMMQPRAIHAQQTDLIVGDEYYLSE